MISFLMESHFGKKIHDAVFEAYGAIFEATNINKAYLIQQAGGEDKFKEARNAVRAVWDAQTMDQFVRNPNQQQKVLNFLILMQIRQPGFVDEAKLGIIHDLANQNSLDQRFLSKVNSDTTPDDAARIIADAGQGAANANKLYPDLSEEEEEVWNRVVVYHTFETGFKWVYAVDAFGQPIGYIPSKITYKTMRHCGNEPSCRDGNQYWGLRGPDGREYLTIILDEDDRIEESKSYGNATNRYADLIKPYVKWFLRDQKVKGVGYRYDYGYAPDKNFGVKDFADEPEFIEEINDTKPSLLGNTERRIMMLHDAIAQNVVTPRQMAQVYMDGNTEDSNYKKLDAFLRQHPLANEDILSGRGYYYGGDLDRDGKNAAKIFGANGFAAMCGACGQCPLSEEELVYYAEHKKLPIREVANYNVKLLTVDVQDAFVRANSYNIDTLTEISNQVGTFKISPNIMRILGGSNDRDSRIKFLKFLAECNPKEKGEPYLEYVRSTDADFLASERRFSTAMEINDRYDGVLGDLSGVTARTIQSCLPDRVNESNRGQEWGKISYLDSILDALAKSSPENIRRVSAQLPDNIGPQLLMLSEDKTMGAYAARLAQYDQCWAVPEEYINSVIGKCNERASVYSRQTQSMVNKILSYVGGLSDAEQIVSYIDRFGLTLLHAIFRNRNATGATMTAYRRLCEVISKAPQLFTSEMVDVGNPYGMDPSGVVHSGREALASLYKNTAMVTDMMFLTPAQIKTYLDTNLNNPNKREVWVRMCVRAMNRNVPLDEYVPALHAAFMSSPELAKETAPLIEGGVFSIPSDEWGTLGNERGNIWVVRHLFALLPTTVVRDPEVYSEIIRFVLTRVTDSDVGDRWKEALHKACNGKGGLAAKVRDRTMEIIRELGNVSTEAIQSLVNAKVIRSADARKMLNIAPDANGGASDGDHLVLLCDNLAKISAKKRVPFIKSALPLIYANTYGISGSVLLHVLKQITDYVVSKMMVPEYDELIKYMAQHVDEADQVFGHRYAGYSYIVECAKYLNGEPVESFELRATPFIKNAWKRPDWERWFRQLDRIADIHQDSTYYWSFRNDILDYGLEKVSGTHDGIRAVMPRSYKYLTKLSNFYRERNYPHSSIIFGIVSDFNANA